MRLAGKSRNGYTCSEKQPPAWLTVGALALAPSKTERFHDFFSDCSLLCLHANSFTHSLDYVGGKIQRTTPWFLQASL